MTNQILTFSSCLLEIKGRKDPVVGTDQLTKTKEIGKGKGTLIGDLVIIEGGVVTSKHLGEEM